MKALSFSQPWLWAIYDPVANKDIENRDWNLPIDMIDVDIVAHAAKSFDDSALPRLWNNFGLQTPSEYTKSAIIGVFKVDRVVTEPRTLTEHQRRWYFGPTRNGKTNYGWILKDRRLLPRPIPWDGALGLWAVPPIIEGLIRRQLAGDYVPTYLPAITAALAAAGVDSVLQWTERHPGQHLWFTYDGLPSCAACGKNKPKETAKRAPKPCRGLVGISLRGEAEGG